MTRIVPLNNVEHAGLRVLSRRGPELGDAVMSAVVVPAEFRNVLAHYPIVFQKSANGRFHPVALFGFEPGQNLFLDGQGGWDAGYLPLSIERLPFVIGRAGDTLELHVDLDSPRLHPDGAALFLPHGGHTQTLQRAHSVMLALHDGLQAAEAFVQALLAHGLLESFAFDITLDDGATRRLAGFYTIHEERLRALTGDALDRLYRDGHVEAAFMAMASLARFVDLIARMNARLARDA